MWETILGDSKDVLPTLGENVFDSLITDPPAGVSFMGKDWDSYSSLGDFRSSLVPVFQASLRTLKPGAHGLVWSLPKTSHHTALALEEAGFEVRDSVLHLFGQGMPKGVNLGKKLGPEWEGWNTTLKPAHETWWLVRKPPVKSITSNVSQYGVGGLNIAECRIGESKRVPGSLSRTAGLSYSGSVDGSLRKETGNEDGHNPNIGRYPSNVVLSHGDQCDSICTEECPVNTLGESAQFFYVPKVSSKERSLGGVLNIHPTAKSLALMRYLIKLVTPRGGVVLDPYMGSATTGVAAAHEGMSFVGIEQDQDMYQIAVARLRSTDSLDGLG